MQEESGRDIFHLYGDSHVAYTLTHKAWTLVVPVLGPASTHAFEDASWLCWHGMRFGAAGQHLIQQLQSVGRQHQQHWVAAGRRGLGLDST